MMQRSALSAMGFRLLAAYVAYRGMTATISRYINPALQNTWIGESRLFTRVSGIVLYILLNAVLVMLLRRRGSKSPKAYRYTVKELVNTFAITYFVCGMADILSGVLIKGTTGIVEQVAILSAFPMPPANIVMLLYTVFLTPVMEELVFRKTLCDGLLPYGKLPAAVISGISFGLFHENLGQSAYASAAGMIFALVYLKTGNAGYAILLHMMVNGFGAVETLLLAAGAADLAIALSIALKFWGFVLVLIQIKRKSHYLISGLVRELKEIRILFTPGMLVFVAVAIAGMFLPDINI